MWITQCEQNLNKLCFPFFQLIHSNTLWRKHRRKLFVCSAKGHSALKINIFFHLEQRFTFNAMINIYNSEKTNFPLSRASEANLNVLVHFLVPLSFRRSTDRISRVVLSNWSRCDAAAVCMQAEKPDEIRAVQFRSDQTNGIKRKILI